MNMEAYAETLYRERRIETRVENGELQVRAIWYFVRDWETVSYLRSEVERILSMPHMGDPDSRRLARLEHVLSFV